MWTGGPPSFFPSLYLCPQRSRSFFCRGGCDFPFFHASSCSFLFISRGFFRQLVFSLQFWMRTNTRFSSSRVEEEVRPRDLTNHVPPPFFRKRSLAQLFPFFSEHRAEHGSWPRPRSPPACQRHPLFNSLPPPPLLPFYLTRPSSTLLPRFLPSLLLLSQPVISTTPRPQFKFPIRRWYLQTTFSAYSFTLSLETSYPLPRTHISFFSSPSRFQRACSFYNTFLWTLFASIELSPWL